MLKNDFFWISQGKVATSEGEVNKSVFMSNFSGFNISKIIKMSCFDKVIREIKKWTFIRDTV